jgi:hypothetical protein
MVGGHECALRIVVADEPLRRRALGHEGVRPPQPTAQDREDNVRREVRHAQLD